MPNAVRGRILLYFALALSSHFSIEGVERRLSKVAATAEAAGGTKDVFYVLDGSPVINGHDDVAFRASVAPADAGPAAVFRSGIWKGDKDTGLVEVIALAGDAAPGRGGAVYTAFSLPAILADGTVMFLASTSPGGLFDALYSGSKHDDVTLVKLASDLASTRFDGFGADDQGTVFALTDSAIVTDLRPDSYTPVARVGAFAPNGGNATYASLSLPSFNDAPAAAFRATLSGAGVSPDNDAGIWVQSELGFTLLAREGGAAPALAANGNQLFFSSLATDPTVDTRGPAAFLSSLTGGVLETSGIFRGTRPGDLSPVALRGGLTATDAGNVAFTTFFSPAMGADGDVYFAATASASGDTRPSALRGVSSLWRAGAGGIHLVAGMAGAAPGTSELLGGISSFAVNANGRVAFIAELYDSAAARFAGFGLWEQEPNGTIVLQVRTGDTVPVTPLDVRTVASGGDAIQLLNPWRTVTDASRRGPAEGVPTGFALGDRAVFRLKFTGGGVFGSYGFFGAHFDPAPPIVAQPVVNSVEDHTDRMPGDGVCDTGTLVGAEPECTLRAAIQETNANADLERVTFKINAAGTPVIFVRSALPAVTKALLIDATTQDGGRVTINGSTAGAGVNGLTIQAEGCSVKGLGITSFTGHGLASLVSGVTLFGPDCSANGMDGISAESGSVQVDGEVKLTGNGGNGLTAMGDVLLGDWSEEVSSNGHDGIRADGKVEIKGTIVLAGNGTKRTPAECSVERAGAISAGGDVVIREIEARSNCGSGVVTDGDITIDKATLRLNTRFGATSLAGGISLGVGDHDVSENKMDGLSCAMGLCEIRWDATLVKNGGFGVFARDIEITGATARFEESGFDGIKADRTILSTAVLTASKNGTKRLPIDCEDRAAGGIVANGDVTLADVVAAENCGSGIYSDNGSVMTGNATLSDNSQFGIRCPSRAVVLNGMEHVLSRNGRDGIFATGGPVRITGKATLYGNGHLQPGECELGKVGAITTQGDLEAEELDIGESCGSGIRAENVRTGNIRSVMNSQFGIAAFGTSEVSLSGEAHDISENKLDGIYAPNATVRIQGTAKINGNNRKLTPEACDQDPPSHGGVFTQKKIEGDSIEASGNCGTGLIASEGLEVGHLDCALNTQHGVFTRLGGVRILGMEGMTSVLSRNRGDGVIAATGRVDISGLMEADENGRNGITGTAVRLEVGEVCRNAEVGIDCRGPGGIELGNADVNCGNGIAPIRTKSGTLVSARGPSVKVGETANPSPGDAPPGQDFPAGFYDVSATSGGNGGGNGGGAGAAPALAVEVALDLAPGLEVETYFNYGPTADRPAPHWYEFRFDGVTGAEILPGGKVVLHIVDGLRGDDDLVVNGSLHGIGGPAITAGGALLQVPGDCNQDGQLNISDPVCVLGYLFLGSPVELPCGDGTAGDAGNRALLDWQPDGGINLADAVAGLGFLFLGGPPHALARDPAGPACVPIVGCPASRGCP